ncbi:hypothetical protein [Burkholderia ubonensis]|uniref:hypothetical protein n=1 Tax=Burkholderia ubonensis TaxID=101571 RepID=UPI00076D9F00|nr:hypothetical protein [Burkholderia ubonensis]KUZ76879.1 hypothetical protein WI37_15980 [Burkholderia ubonensis]
MQSPVESDRPPRNRKVSRAGRIWYGLSCVCAIEGLGLLAIAPYWRGGTILGEVNGLAMFVFGVATLFFLLGRCEPGKTLATQGLRYLFALLGGTATNVVLTWGLWSIHFPIVNGTIQRGLMGENYWLGPAILAYAVVVWLFYRSSLNRERSADARP